VGRGKLTEFQAGELLAGRGSELVFGEYSLLEPIGAGGMGRVFKALHRSMGRVVALKLMSETALSDPDAVRRFEREIRAAGQLLHPNIVTAFDANQARGIHYLAMEYVPGRDLAALTAGNKTLSIAATVELMAQAAGALAYAHQQGIIHRDVKPANLLVDPSGRLKILDLGLARLMQPTLVEGSLTGSGDVIGTIDYMAPEQAVDIRAADARSDIYGLGCTLCRLLTGAPPYGGATVVERIMAHREAPVPSLAARRRDVPPELDAIFARMVAKRPEERFASMAEVIAALAPLAAPAGSAAAELALLVS